ncbi:unnamed protein product, partial [Ectocarpus sp. 8 AP-2014]
SQVDSTPEKRRITRHCTSLLWAWRHCCTSFLSSENKSRATNKSRSFGRNRGLNTNRGSKHQHHQQNNRFLGRGNSLCERRGLVDDGFPDHGAALCGGGHHRPASGGENSRNNDGDVDSGPSQQQATAPLPFPAAVR